MKFLKLRVKISDRFVVWLVVGNPASTVDLLTSMENPENASAVENLPHFVENACIKRSDSRCVRV